MTDNSANDYTPFDKFTQGSAADVTYEGERWIWQLLSKRNSTETDKVTDYVNIEDKNTVNFYSGNVSATNLAGIYKTDHYYYAVTQDYNNSYSKNGAEGLLTFTNTRIGVISYKLEMDWKIGNLVDNLESVHVNILNKGTGVYYEATIPVKKDGALINDYFIFNLPKYDVNGKVIPYEIKEISLKDTSGNTHSFADGNDVMLDDCTCSISTIGRENGAFHTDDLITVRITNKNAGTVDFKITKLWKDDNNILGLRGDVYIKLYRITDAPNAKAVPYTPEHDYIRENVTESSADYVFRNLPKYDNNGYRYTYYVEESPTPSKYRATYDNSEALVEKDSIQTTAPASSQSTTSTTTTTLSDKNTGGEAETTTTAQPDVAASENIRKNITAAYNNGCIINTLYDEVVIKGEKLWQNISSVLDKKDYPVAHVTLSVKKKYQDTVTDISKTDIMEGDNKFFLTTPLAEITQEQYKDYFILNDDGSLKKILRPGMTNESKYYDLVLPRYDEDGCLITYGMREEAINSYAFHYDGGQRIINEYDGGAPVKFTVSKNFDPNPAVKPTIRVTLYQKHYSIEKQKWLTYDTFTCMGITEM